MNPAAPEQVFLFQVLKGEQVVPGDELDLEILLQLFQRHRLLPLAPRFMRYLPQDTRAKWKNMVQRRTMHSHHLYAETLRIIAQLKQAGIHPLPLKGALLAHALYGDPGARHFNDIDLVVNKVELAKTKEVLTDAGYHQIYPGNLFPKQDKLYSKYKKDAGFFHKEKKLFIELHYGIYLHELMRAGDECKLLQNRQPVKLSGTEIQVMDRESTFIYLLYHGCLHQFFRLFWLRDVAECLERWDLDHDKVLALIKKLGFERLLSTGLRLAKDYFGTEVPDACSQVMIENDRMVQKLVHSCHQRIRGPEEQSFRTKINRHLYLMRLKPGLSYKWAVVWSIIQRWRIRKFMGGH